MNSEQDLIRKLMVSKQIMDKHNTIGRGQAQDTISRPMVDEFQPINGTYNIPQDLMEETQPQKSYNTEAPTEDRIKNSRLPDEIKQLMLEHPIQQPTMGVNTGTAITPELAQKASRLMGVEKNNVVVENQKRPQQTQIDNNDIRSIIRETVEDVLRENGLIAESETKSNEVFKFRVGQHIFEGKVTNIKKVPKK
jgi:hypothetical protein